MEPGRGGELAGGWPGRLPYDVLAPPGVVHVWLVLRDSRTGADFGARDLTVMP